MSDILVVDDSKVMRDMIIACLRSERSFRFTHAASGLEAIERMSISRFDLLILDLVQASSQRAARRRADERQQHAANGARAVFQHRELGRGRVATGEEPLSLAMMLANRGLLDHVEIVATDLNRAGLRRAREGVFRGRSLRALPHPEMRDYLTLSGDRAIVAPALTAAIDWRRVNLIDDAAVSALGSFDLVLCRNVLIYFSDATTRRVLERIDRVLVDEGALAVGLSESLIRFGTALECREHDGYFFYERRR